MTTSRDVRLALVVAAGLLVAWSVVTPIFEGPDEFAHWQYARHLHDRWRLPVYAATFAEGNSPPLYYALVAPVATRTVTPPPAVWIDGVDAFAMPLVPRFFLGAADDLRHYWPIRHARLATVLMSLITIALCARLGFEATGRVSTALLAAGLVAFLPQFTFRGSHVSNDALVTTMAAATLWGMVGIVRHGFTWRRGLLAAVMLAAAFLTKINAICLAPALALAIVTEPVPWRARLTHLSVLGVTLALVAPWCVRNAVLYGDPLAIGAMPAAVAPLVVERVLSDGYFVTQLPRELFKTFVGAFGHMTVTLPRPVYVAYLAFFAIAGIGLLRRVRHEARLARLLLVIAAIVVGALAVVVRINLQFHQPQGRYLFPALPAIALAMALGLDTWGSWVARATVAAWALANAAILALVVGPAYQPPPVPRVSKALAIVRPQPVRDLTADPRASGEAAGTYEVTGAEPELAADVRVPAADALFVMFDVEARAPARQAAAATTTNEATDTTETDAGSGSDDADDSNAGKFRDLDGVVVLTRSAAPGDAGGHAKGGAVEDTEEHTKGDAAGDAAGDAEQTEEVRVPFRWRADGRRRTIYLTLVDRPGWQGTVTRLRVRPIAQAPGDLRGLAVIVRQVRLAGSIPSYDY